MVAYIYNPNYYGGRERKVRMPECLGKKSAKLHLNQ
jgi:hypothetical protein